MDKRPQIVNIINFIRGLEPRDPELDLVEPVEEQIRLMKQYGLHGTFLLQYDALKDPRFLSIIKALDPKQFEIGVWHEIVKPMTDRCGIPWRGRWAWDWHVHCGFSLGYTKDEREKLVDALFEGFCEEFGYYPRVFGSWLFDSHTLAYISDKYGLDAACNCKEQYGTDGYTLWGGYYGQGYYPSRTNMFMPAQKPEQQLPVPIFRMLGSDPIYQYDMGLSVENGIAPLQGVMTLEPVYTTGDGHNGHGGGDPGWVDWFIKQNYSGECLSFGYAQAGQENSFGWKLMGKGLEYQFARFAELQSKGIISAETLGETGQLFKREYAQTPASVIAAHGAFDDNRRSSVWYSSRFYRTNIYLDHDMLRIRDLHMFDGKHPDPYEGTVCKGNTATYETLPIADGNRFSGNGILAGIYIDNAHIGDELQFTDLGNGCASVICGEIEFTLGEDILTVYGARSFTLENRMSSNCSGKPEVINVCKNALTLRYDGTEYTLRAICGHFIDAHTIASTDGKVSLKLHADE